MDGIICTEISRLARNFGDGGMILWYLQNGTISHIYTPSKVFTSSSADQLMVAIEFALSKKSSDDTSYRTKETMKTRARTLKHPSRPAILGYKGEGPKGARKWIIDKKIGPLVRQVFREFATGKYTFKEIAEYAYRIGIRSKARKTTTGKLSENTWHGRLRDRQYTGIFIDNDEEIVGEYERLIDSDLFYAVQAVIQNNKHPKESHIDYPYSNKLIACGLCGDWLSGTNKKGITYYRCAKRRLPCKNITPWPYVPEVELEKQLIKEFNQIEIDEQTWHVARDYVVELNQPQKFDLKRKVRDFTSQIGTEAQRRIDIGNKYIDSKISKREHDALLEDSHKNEAHLRKQLVKCENLVHELDELMYQFLDDIKYITKRLETSLPTNKREMVNIFCENLTWKEGKLRWDWKKPYYILAKQSKNPTVLPRVDSDHEP